MGNSRIRIKESVVRRQDLGGWTTGRDTQGYAELLAHTRRQNRGRPVKDGRTPAELRKGTNSVSQVDDTHPSPLVQTCYC